MAKTSVFRALVLCIAFFFFIGLSPIASADCTESRVKNLSRQGKTVAAIAKACEMDKADVQSILGQNEDEDESEGEGKLPKGAPVGQCGCWGPVNPSHREPQPNCMSGKAKPKLCNAMCPMGGYMWQGVCT